MIQYLKAFLFTLFILHHSSFIIAQHPVWHQYTTADGLPSNAVYGMLQDHNGFLWFATNLGVCKFNGYEFHKPVDTSRYASSEAYKLAEDAQGRIWFNRLDASVWLVENDTVRSWKYNYMIKKYQGDFVNFGALVVQNNGAVWEHLPNLGILVVQPDSSYRIFPSTDQSAIILATVDGKAILGTQSPKKARLKNGITPEIFRLEKGNLLSLGKFRLGKEQFKKIKTTGVWLLRNGDFIFNFQQTFYLLHDNQLVWSGKKEVIVNDIYEDTDGALLLSSLGEKHQGLLRFRSLQDFMQDKFSNVLPQRRVVSSLRDHEGGWWAITTDAGVFYCKNPDLEIFDISSGLPFDNVQSITSDQHSTIYASLRPKGICAISKEGSVAQLPTPVDWIVSDESIVRFDTLTSQLWFNPYVCYRKNNHWKNIRFKNPIDYTGGVFMAKKITSSRFNGLWWASSFRDFHSIDPVQCTSVRYSTDTLDYCRTHSVAQDFEGNIWVATENYGLRIWRNKHLEPPPFSHPALRYPVRLLEILPDSTLLISLRGGGLLFRRKNGTCTHLTMQDGLSTNWLSELDIGPDGTVYASSNAGLNILRPQGNGIWSIETISTEDGLPSNQVNDITWLGNDLWIATDRGIVRFHKKPNPATVHMPLLERFLVNNKEVAFSENLQLSHLLNNISLRFFTLHYRSGGDIGYRYRLFGADTSFVYTHNREVNFINLAPGKYCFEVQAQGEKGEWSPSNRWTFSIQPPWWASWWFLLLCAALAVASVLLYYRNRFRAIRQEAADREKMRDLEAAALRAQMNPHFIFNCLQSIQYFIARNERDVAIGYLARFAKLIRLTLHGSVDGLHSLTEEISMLENFLFLEQMRFKGKFEFSIQTAPGIEPETIRLPPLLVQPFVENALIHGLKERESDGQITIAFAKKKDSLEVTVTDNGKGFSEKSKQEADTKVYNSVGMLLTQKRLDLLTGTGAQLAEHFSRETLFDEKGIVTGACVRFEVPVLQG